MRFLAVLELYKQGMVDVAQFTNFGELMVRRLSDGESALDLVSVDDWDDPAEPLVERDDIDLDDVPRRRRRPARGARGPHRAGADDRAGRDGEPSPVPEHASERSLA